MQVGGGGGNRTRVPIEPPESRSPLESFAAPPSEKLAPAWGPPQDGRPLPAAYFWCILICMRTTLLLNDTLLREAQRLTGLGEKTAVVHAGLEALIARESARRLAALGGSQPRMRSIPRRRPKKNG